jgi:hypothetical protein
MVPLTRLAGPSGSAHENTRARISNQRAARSDVPIDAFLHWKEMSMRRGVAIAALVGGFVAATSLPAAAQYVGWNDWGGGGVGVGVGGVGVSVGFGAPRFYGGYAAYPGYYAAGPAAYPYSGPYAYSEPSYGGYGYADAPAYSYGTTTVYEPGFAYYEPGYAYGSSGYVGGYREGIRSRSYAAGGYREGIRSRSYAAGGYREGIRSRSAVRSARPDVGDRTFSRGTRSTTLRTGSNARSTSAARQRGNAGSASMPGNETTGRGGASMQPSGMSGGASLQGGTTGQSGQRGGQAGR